MSSVSTQEGGNMESQQRYLSIDIWSDENEPAIELSTIKYRVQLPKIGENFRNNFFYAEVDKYGMVSVKGIGCNWFGAAPTFNEMMEYLVEWELAVLRSVSYEDMEYFATKKLCKFYGLE
jgi:hypothetical protein